MLTAVATSFLTRLSGRFDPREADRLKRALELACRAHAGQSRDDGTPYVDHPVRVALILLDEVRITDADVLCAALLHDTMEDCPMMSLERLEHDFGPRIRHIVETLTKPPNEGRSREEINAIYFSRIENADDSCKLVKLADKLDNVRDSIHSKTAEKRMRTAEEAERFYIPLAALLSMDSGIIFERLLKIAIDDAL